MTVNKKHEKFKQSKRKHVLMITNHGCHAPKITVTIDTAGQNFYVNDYAKALILLGYKVTILNRGGYTHPISKEEHKGIKYYEAEWGEEIGEFCRVIYLEDSIPEFIPKEKLDNENFIKEKEHFMQIASEINIDLNNIYYMNSHYWDAGILGIMINEELEKQGHKKLPHVWTPHSIGILKQKNYKDEPEEIVKKLKFPTRIAFEEKVIKEVDGVARTAEIMTDILKEYDSEVENNLWFPPGVDTTLYHPREKDECTNAIKVLSEETDKSEAEILKMIKEKTVIYEISRTQESKRKDTILDAFTNIENPDKAVLIMAINKGNETYDKLIEIYEKNKDKNIILLDRFLSKTEAAELFALSDIFTTAAQMETWGMTSHEAAASECAIIASKYIPSVYEVLKDYSIIIDDDKYYSYTQAMDELILDPEKRQKMAQKSKQLVFDHYSWKALTKNFLEEMKEKNIIN